VLEAIALAIAVACIVTYLYLAVTGRALLFNICNAFGWPVFIVSVQHGAYQAAMLNLFFTLVGTIGVITELRKRHRTKYDLETPWHFVKGQRPVDPGTPAHLLERSSRRNHPSFDQDAAR